MRIILDAMGGDNAPLAPVMGAVQATKDFGAEITLVGRGEAPAPWPPSPSCFCWTSRRQA